MKLDNELKSIRETTKHDMFTKNDIRDISNCDLLGRQSQFKFKV